ncbi:MAG: hypothetical protein AB7F64_00600 [Gammaproteobacteria bacterium]
MFRAMCRSARIVGQTPASTARLFSSRSPFLALEDEPITWTRDHANDCFRHGHFTMHLIEIGNAKKARVFYQGIMQTFDLSSNLQWKILDHQFDPRSVNAPNGC